jgi:phage portal protein BeeE
MGDVLMENKLVDKIANRLGFERKVDQPPDLGKSVAPIWPENNWRFNGWGWNRSSASRVDYKAELGDLDGHSLVMAVVNYTGIRLPEARPAVVMTTASGKDESNFTHPLCNLIRRPNQFNIWANYTQAISVDWWITGNVYFLKVRNRVTGEVRELWNIPSFLIVPRWYGDGRAPEVPERMMNGEPSSTYLSHYEYRIPGRTAVLYERSEFVHIKRGSDALRRGGVSAFEPLVNELYGDNKMAAFTATIMRNMGIQVPLISPKDQTISISEEKGNHMKELWMAKTTGDRAGEPVINTIPVDVEKFGFSPTELDLSALRLIPESRVAAVCQIPATTLGLLVGLQNGTSYASSAQARQQGYEEVIIPIQQAWAEEINWQLLPEFEKNTTARFEFDTAKVRVLQEDQDTLVKRNSEVFKTGATSVEQYLSAIGMEPDDSEVGKLHFVPSLVTPKTVDDLLNPPAPADPLNASVIDPALAKLVDMDRYLESLERQMAAFKP